MSAPGAVRLAKARVLLINHVLSHDPFPREPSRPDQTEENCIGLPVLVPVFQADVSGTLKVHI
jgi:hypothetical protein